MFSFLNNIFSRSSAVDGEPRFFKHDAPAGSVAVRVSDESEAHNGNGNPSADGVSLPLQAVVKGLPKTLQVAIQTPPDAQMRAQIPLQTIASQLPSGAVNVTFAELRRGSPHGVFSSSPIFDKKRVNLPLEDILISVKLTRRPNQRQTAMPDDIPPLFTSEGKALVKNGSSHNGSDDTVAETKPPTIPPAEPAEPQAPPSPPSPDVPTAAASPTPPDADPPALKFPYSTEAAVEKPAVPKTPEPDPKAAEAPASNLIDADAGTNSAQHIELAFEAISDVIPEAIQEEIGSVGVETVIEIPLAELAPMMARGKILFPWGKLRGWTKPSPPATKCSDVEVSLPLKEIIPLFMAAHRPAKRASIRMVAGKDIPNVFQGPGRGGSPFKVVKDEEPIVTEAETPMQAPALDPQDPNAEWHPKEYLEESMALEGVDGVVFASHDGLVVAEKMPPHIDGRALAAFLPEMFGRTADYLIKCHIGSPDWMILQVDGRMLQVSKAGQLCLAILGEVGKPLPRAKLREIMNRLAEAQPVH